MWKSDPLNAPRGITFPQIQDGQHGAAPSFTHVIVGDAGVEAGVAGFAIPNPQPSVLLVVHVEELIVVVPVQGGLGVSSHSHLQTDVAARPHGGVPHFACENGRSRGGVTGSWKLRDHFLQAHFGPLRRDGGATGRRCFACPLFQGHLHLSFSHGLSDLGGSCNGICECGCGYWAYSKQNGTTLSYIHQNPVSELESMNRLYVLTTVKLHFWI